ncbi:MAG TPA: hypothetical protein VGF75_01065, partial [Candidatus Saccharimonadales bacterium]
MDNNRPRRRPGNIDGFMAPKNKEGTPVVKPVTESTSPITKMADSGSLLNTTIPGRIYPSTPM